MTTLPQSVPTWRTAKRLLCIRLDSLGDVLMMTPAVRALKQSVADRQITFLTSPSGAAAARHIPEIDDVLVYAAPWIKSAVPSDCAADLSMIEALRAARFDAAVVFTTFSQNPLPAALLCHLAGIPLRLAHCHENPYRLLTDWAPDPDPENGIRHEVRRQLDLVGSIGAQIEDERLSMHVPAEAQERVRGLLHELGIDQGKPWTVVHPGSTAASRRYPPEMYAEVVRQLVAVRGWHVVLTGAASESTLLAEIATQAAVPVQTLAGALNLGELAAMIARSPVVITNNTGPSHIAAAVGTPVVCLYALTNPQHTPWMVPSRVLSYDVPCRWCYRSVCPEGHHACLRSVPPEAVVSAAMELTRAASGGRASG